MYTFLFKRLGECTFWTWEWKAWNSFANIGVCLFQLIVLFPSLLTSSWKYFPSKDLEEVKEISGLGRLEKHGPQNQLKSDQFQISSAALPEISHHILWRTFHSLLRFEIITLPILATSLKHSFFKRLGVKGLSTLFSVINLYVNRLLFFGEFCVFRRRTTIGFKSNDTLDRCWRIFEHPKPRLNFPPSPLHNVDQTRNDHSAGKSDQHWLGGRGEIWQTLFFLAVVRRSSRKFQNFAECVTSFATDWSLLVSHVIWKQT